MNKNIITIVTVTYNAKNLLEDTILSIINQTYEDIEYIIIDGGSTDGTIDIIEQYEDKIDYWISEPDDGIYYAMNKAIKKATGEWINFMNAGDTFADLNTVEYVMDHKDIDSELIYGNFYKKYADITVNALDRSKWFTTMPFCHQTLFTKTNLMRKEPFDTDFKIVADYNFIITMHKQDRNFCYLDKTLAIFTEGGYANSNTLKMCIESLKVLMDNELDMEDIYLTSWFQYLNNAETRYADLQHKYNLDLDKYNLDLDFIYNLISDFFSTKLYKNPIEKLKAGRRLYLLYKSSLK